MGTESVSFTVTACISRHNSARDLLDQALWLEIQGRVRQILEDEKYQQITAWIV